MTLARDVLKAKPVPRLSALFGTRDRDAAAVAIPVKSLEERAAEVIEHHRRYWATLWANLAMNLSAVAFIVGVPYVIFEASRLALLHLNGVALPQFRFMLSGPSALAAFAILATLVVALQVSVRAPLPTDDLAAAEARQISLEALARLCGASAIAVGVSAAFGQLPMTGTLDAMRYLGPLAGAVLLALFAGDAASASNERLGAAMTVQREMIATDRLATAASKLEADTDSPQWRGYLLQTIVGLMLVPAVTVGVYFLMWPVGTLSLWFVLAAAGFFAALEAVAIALIVTVRNLWIRNERVSAGYWAFLLGVCALTVAALAYAYQPPPLLTDARSLVWRSSVALVMVSAWTVATIALATRLPWSRHRAPGTAILMGLLRFSIRRSNRTAASKEPGLPARLWALVALCLVVPPVGFLCTMRLGGTAAARGNRRYGQVRQAALWIGLLGSVVWAAAVVSLVVVNPSV